VLTFVTLVLWGCLLLAVFLGIVCDGAVRDLFHVLQERDPRWTAEQYPDLDQMDGGGIAGLFLVVVAAGTIAAAAMLLRVNG
jgi:hypothetical protein